MNALPLSQACVLAGVAVLCLTVAGARAADQPWLAAPKTVAPPDDDHALAARKFQGIPSLAIAPKGRLWAIWYAGKSPGEDHNNYVVLATSGDDGKSWSEVLVIDPDGPGPVRAFDPQVWTDPQGRLWAFWAQAIGHDASVGGVWAVTAAEGDAARPKWSAPRRLTDGVMMGKPFVLSTGEWVLPASTWAKTDHSARIVVSTDAGETWALRGGCNVPAKDRAFDEHLFIERPDKSLWLLARTRYGIGESVSTDGGKTWPQLAPAALKHPSARFFIRRLASGKLLLVKHGPVDRQTGRQLLGAFLSGDEGKTWRGPLMLDERAGVSYPDGQQGADGLIRIIYDRDRTGAREILMARFAEKDILAEEGDRERVTLRMVVSRHPPASSPQGKP